MNVTSKLNHLKKLTYITCIVCTYPGHFIRYLSNLAIEHITKIKPTTKGQS